MIEFDRDMLVLRVGFLIPKNVVRSMEQTKTKALRVPHSCDPFGQVDFPIFKKGFQGRGCHGLGSIRTSLSLGTRLQGQADQSR